VAPKRVTRKELLKEPDEFLTTSGIVVQYFRDNPRMGTLAGVGVAAIMAAIIGWYGYSQHARSAGHEIFEKAYRSYQAAALSAEPVPREKWDQIFKEFDAVAEAYPSWPAGETALLYTGHVLYKMQDFERALKRYDRMKSTNLVKQGLDSLVMYNRAMTLIALKDYDKALVILNDFSKNTDSPYRREAFASIAKIYEFQGKKKEAVQAYRQYLKIFPQAPDAALVKARIANLAAQG